MQYVCHSMRCEWYKDNDKDLKSEDKDKELKSEDKDKDL